MEDEAVRVRNATSRDLAALVDVYNHYVSTSHATFDIEPKTLDERRRWFAGFSSAGPHRLFVAESANQIVGYASSKPFHQRPAYRTSVETSIYLHPKCTGRSIGFELYRKLLDELERCEDVHQAFAGVAVPNPGSVALHCRLGFELVGTFREVGYKFERFWSVSWYQRSC